MIALGLLSTLIVRMHLRRLIFVPAIDYENNNYEIYLWDLDKQWSGTDHPVHEPMKTF